MEKTDQESGPYVDPDFFESRKKVGDDFVIKLVIVFRTEAPKLMEKIKVCSKKSGENGLVELGHRLNGMCLNVGATVLSGIGEEIEEKAGRDDFVDIDKLLNKMDDVYKHTIREMEQLIKE